MSFLLFGRAIASDLLEGLFNILSFLLGVLKRSMTKGIADFYVVNSRALFS